MHHKSLSSTAKKDELILLEMEADIKVWYHFKPIQIQKFHSTITSLHKLTTLF